LSVAPDHEMAATTGSEPATAFTVVGAVGDSWSVLLPNARNESDEA